MGIGPVTGIGEAIIVQETMPEGDVAHVRAFHRHHSHSSGRSQPSPSFTAPQVFLGSAALQVLQKQCKVPNFDGKPENWLQFVRDWDKWSANSLMGGPPLYLEVMKRDLFVTCLHRVLREHYENLIVLKPSMTFRTSSVIWRDSFRWTTRSGHGNSGRE